MDIIQQTMEIITKGYHDNLEKALRGSMNISDIVVDLQKKLNEAGVILLKDTMETLDDAIRESKSRKKNWHIQRRSDIKSIATPMGEVTYERTYYKHKKTKEYAYLSDEHFGIEPHDRMDDSLKAKLVKNAISESYQGSVNREVHCGITSKTAVMRAIRSLGDIPNDAAPIPEGKIEKDILYIEADEDHVAMQKGPCQISKMIYVHEGRELVSKGRYRLINPRYFSDMMQNSEELWLDVAEYIQKTYNTNRIKKVFLSGDGAGWIKEGLGWIDKSTYVLDKFHLAKYIRTATGHMEHARYHLWHYIQKGMSRATADLLDILAEEAETKHKRKEVLAAKTYILNNWEGIQRQKSENYIGCSAEGHVSHVLSDRLSSRPMGWSEMGKEQMARLRVFDFNGGNIYEYIKKDKKETEKAKRIENLDKRILRKAKKAHLETLGNITVLNIGKKTGTATLLKSVRGF